jgi:hypothetical protein
MRKSEVLAALQRLVATPQCQVCGANAWGSLGPEGQEVPIELEASGLNEFVKCEVLSCNLCGYIRLHATQALEAVP